MVSARVLIVEDDRALSAMLDELFTAEGYRVETAYDAQAGKLFVSTNKAANFFATASSLPVAQDNFGFGGGGGGVGDPGDAPGDLSVSTVGGLLPYLLRQL